MLRLAAALLLCLAACGGSPEPFTGDRIVAELRGGQPYCGPGRTGPTITTRTETVPFGASTYEQHIIECDWTCADTGVYQRAFAYVTFHTDELGRWVRNFYVDPRPERAVCL